MYFIKNLTQLAIQWTSPHHLSFSQAWAMPNRIDGLVNLYMQLLGKVQTDKFDENPCICKSGSAWITKFCSLVLWCDGALTFLTPNLRHLSINFDRQPGRPQLHRKLHPKNRFIQEYCAMIKTSYVQTWPFFLSLELNKFKGEIESGRKRPLRSFQQVVTG